MTESAVTIGLIQPSEWQSYKALRVRALQTDPQAFGSTLQRTLEREDSFWIGRLQEGIEDHLRSMLFASVAGELVGMIGVYPDQVTEQPGIISMYVCPEHRGQGIGRKLMEAMLARLADEETVFLDVRVCQESAVRLYESMGFRTFKISGEGELAELHMRRDRSG
jgi:ribosomal protein S18 acetylase RimI-like enzyme